MKKLLFGLAILVAVGAGCASSDTDMSDTTAVDTTPTATTSELSAEVKQIKDNMEVMQVAAQTDNCDGLLIQFAPDVATEDDCADIAAFMLEKQAFSAVDWASVEADGTSADLVDANGRVLAEMVWDDSGVIWGYKLNNRFWE